MSCTGCGACAVACSLGCVAMEPNDEGFLYPTVDGARCVDCSKCVESCVADGSDDLRTPQKALLARARASEARRSSSGGIAYVLARMVLDEGGAVVACALDENGVARHRAFDRADDLWRMQGSKYVQSDATAGYELCCERLRQGRRVLYIGMPCQVAAAKRLVGGDSRLLTVDVVCHGVPSPGFWQKDLSFQNDWGRLLNRQTVMFRSSGRRSRSAFELYDDAGGRAVPYELDAFFTLFMRGGILQGIVLFLLVCPEGARRGSDHRRLRFARSLSRFSSCRVSVDRFDEHPGRKRGARRPARRRPDRCDAD